MRYSYNQGVVNDESNRLTLIVSSILVALLVTFMAVVQNVSAATSTVTVTGNTSAGENQPGWLFNRDASTATPYEFNSDEAQIGVGSLYVKPIGANASDKFIGENFINDAVADVKSVSFDFKIGAGGTAADTQQFYMNVYANFGQSDDLKFYDCRYNVVASVGSTAAWSTVTFDPTQAYPVTTRGGAAASPFTCPAVPADMDDLSAGSNIRMFSVNVGDTNINDLGLDAYLDNVVVSASGDVTTYDFEPVVSITNKNDCKNGGWMTSNTPVYKNQGQCVSSVVSKKNN